MQALIPIAGMGCRLAAITDLPKCLLTVDGKSLLAHTLDQALALGCDEAILVVRDDIVQERMGEDYRDLPLRYVTQPEALGLGHALVQARSVITGHFLVFFADFWRSGPFSAETCRLFRQGDAPLVLVSRQPERFMSQLAAVVLNNDESIARIVEKPAQPPSSWAEAGLYRFPPELLDAPLVYTPGQGFGYTLQAIENWLIEQGFVMRAVKGPANWINVNEPEDLFLARARAAALSRPTAEPEAAGTADDFIMPPTYFPGMA